MFRFKAFVLLACMLALTAVAGCGDSCLSLANAICSCQLDPNSQAVCNANAKAQESTFAVGKLDEKFCQGKLDDHSCDCNKLNTQAGREACGLVIAKP
jgi:hypothetical protein